MPRARAHVVDLMESFLATQQSIKGLEQEIEEVGRISFSVHLYFLTRDDLIFDRPREAERKSISVLLHRRNKSKRKVCQSKQTTMIRKNG